MKKCKHSWKINTGRIFDKNGKPIEVQFRCTICGCYGIEVNRYNLTTKSDKYTIRKVTP